MASYVPPSFQSPMASMGYVGFVRFNNVNGGQSTVVRATSCDLHVEQEITTPDVVDSRFDRTVYQLGPKIARGSCAFPAIYDRYVNGAGIGDVATNLWKLAVRRDATGHLGSTSIDVKYANKDASFQYKECIIDQYEWSAEAEGGVNISSTIIGAGRDALVMPEPSDIDNTRMVTWNDVILNIALGPNGSLGSPARNAIRRFNVTLANNAQLVYTFNRYLAPQDIVPTKRDVSGSITFMGRIGDLASYAEDNDKRCFEESTITFGYGVETGGCGGGMLVTLPNVVFKMETMELTNELFETTMEFISLPAASMAYDPLDIPD